MRPSPPGKCEDMHYSSAFQCIACIHIVISRSYRDQCKVR